MKNHTRKIKKLLKKWNTNSLSKLEEQELDEWYDSLEFDLPLQKEEEFLSADVFEEKRSHLLEKINQRRNRSKIFYLRKIAAAAAAAIVLLVTGGVIWKYTLQNDHQPVADIHKKEPVKLQDIKAGQEGAILSLANGETVVLDSTGNGQIAMQGGAAVANENGQLSYKTLNNSPGEVVYNTLSTPAGREYRLVLPDGSKVWLNATSSISFPTEFSGNERIVKLTGEAFFEVVKAQGKGGNKPFKIEVNSTLGKEQNVKIEVLGTAFNVNAYEDESTIKTSLVEGKVRMHANGKSSDLKPSQQSVINEKGEHLVHSQINMDEVLGWKNGIFYFNKTDISTILRQFSRWYNIEIISKETYGRSFSGKISRESKLIDVLKIMDLSNISYTMQGGKLIIDNQLK